MIALLSVFALFFAAGGEYPKRYTEQITIAGLERTGKITGDAAHVQFSVGPGPGNTVNGVPMVTGWIISDWLAEVREPSVLLPRYEVAFHITAFKGTPREKRERYVVTYVYDPSSRRGYVRLPGRDEPFWDTNSSLMYRGPQFEGRWFVATEAWTNAAEAALSN